eukprot:TRINITY_DN5898_c0_g1_i1.p1 TRINITY_DN5898_c0_g1~~TRINITY_DN5898_c0_g1_i1.p1  ORF type:complete len:609 (+),score=58.86 TRINITY_DN5898_c0_g1_i1:53-1879(+)
MTLVSKIAASVDVKCVFLSVGIAGCLLLERLRRRRTPGGGASEMVPGHWLLGTLPAMVRAFRANKGLTLLHQFHVTHGKTVIIYLPLRGWMVKTTCPENVRHILKTRFDNYPKGPLFVNTLHDLLGGGIFNSDGSDWHTQRKVSSHMFTAKLFREHIWIVVRRNARKLRDVFESQKPDAVVDVFDLLNRFTLDTIGEIGFGKCVGSLDDPSSPFMQSFDKAQQVSFWRSMNPLWRLMRRVGVGLENEARDHFGLLDAYSRDIGQELREACRNIAKKRSNINWADLEASKSFVGLFLEDAHRRGETLSDDYVRDLVLNFLIAGRDTTAQALSWTIFCLSQHPDVEEKVRQEIIDVCGVRGPSYEDLNSLVYLNAVLHEALRLHPSVPLEIKMALKDDVWPDGTFIPASTNVVYDIYSMGRDTRIWGDDALVFRPERWLERKEPPDNYTYPVFNGGPRECLGRRLALVEMKTCLAILLPSLKFKLAVPRCQITPHTQLTIGMGQGLPCYVSQYCRKGGSSGSTTDRSEGNATISDNAESTDVERTSDNESDWNSQHGSTSEVGSTQDQRALRQRNVKRLSGWSRRRRNKYWQHVRDSTPERWPDEGKLSQ